MKYTEEEQVILTALEEDELLPRKPDAAEKAAIKGAAVSTFFN